MEASWFAGRLRGLAEGAGLTQQQLAERAGLTREGIAQLETGCREPAWKTALAVAKALGVSCEAFVQKPARRAAAGPGRPRKAAGEPGAGLDAAEARGAGKPRGK